MNKKGIRATESDVGRFVIYRVAPQFRPEEGVITSVNKHTVFVRYGKDKTSKATRPEDLEWMLNS